MEKRVGKKESLSVREEKGSVGYQNIYPLITMPKDFSIQLGERKRRYKAAFIAKLSDAESEACETQVWVEFARRCKDLDDKTCNELDETYDKIMAQIVKMINEADKWLIK